MFRNNKEKKELENIVANLINKSNDDITPEVINIEENKLTKIARDIEKKLKSTKKNMHFKESIFMKITGIDSHDDVKKSLLLIAERHGISGNDVHAGFYKYAYGPDFSMKHILEQGATVYATLNKQYEDLEKILSKIKPILNEKQQVSDKSSQSQRARCSLM